MPNRLRAPALRHAAYLAALESELVTLTVTPRQRLPHALNGQPIAPACAYAEQTIKNLNSGRSRAWLHITSVLVANQDDGVPLETLLAPLKRLTAALRMRDASRPQQVHSLAALFRAEQRANCAFDIAEHAVGEQCDDIATLEEAIRRADQQIATSIAYREECEARLASLRPTAPATRTPPSMRGTPAHAIRRSTLTLA